MVTKDNIEIKESQFSYTIIKDGPLEFALDSIDGKIIVIAVLEEGIIQKHGGIQAGDQLSSVNNIDFRDKSLEYVVEQLELLMDDKSVDILNVIVNRIRSLNETYYINKIMECDENQENVEITSL